MGIVILLIILISASAFFSSSETSYLSLSKVTIRQMIKDKVPGAKRVVTLKNDMDRLLTTILIGNNFVNNLASSAATALAVSLFGSKGVGTATIVMTLLIIVFGEILPKTIATYNYVSMAKTASLPLTILQKIMFPIVWIFAKLTKAVGNLVDIIWKSDTPLVTEEELKTLIDVGNTEGTLENEERDMLYKIFEFTDLRVRDITRHRSFVQDISKEASYAEAVQTFSKSGYSRLPVYSEDEEGIKEYVGLLHYKSLLYFHGDKQQKNFAKDNMMQMLFVGETQTVISLLHTLKKDKVSFVTVIDEHGDIAGIATMDDILNAVMGRITDEYAKTPPEKRIKILSSTEYILPGDLRLTDVNDIFHINCESEEFDTMGGWLLEQIGYLPATDEVYTNSKGIFIAEDVANRRIQSIRLKLNLKK